jgi:folate-binding protein YgfZ
MSDGAVGTGVWTRLTGLGVLRVSGSDAVPFMQGQLSNDVERLRRDRVQLSALNTPQGRVVALPRLALRPEGIIAILPATLVPPVIERLKKYVLRAKVTLADESERWAIAGLLEESTPGAAEGDSGVSALVGKVSASDEISLHTVGGTGERRVLVGPPAALASLATRFPSAPSPDRWRLAAIACGEPQVYAATSDLFVAQMLNLDLVDGVSFTKGCYTGQEIIARTQHRGRIKRRMLRYRVPGSAVLSPGDTVQIERISGRVVEFAARDATECEILAVMSLEGTVPADATELSAERLPLPYAIPEFD